MKTKEDIRMKWSQRFLECWRRKDMRKKRISKE